MWDEAAVSHMCQMNEETIQIKSDRKLLFVLSTNTSDYPEQTKLGCHVYVSQSVRMKFPPSPANLQSSHTCCGPLLPLCYNFFCISVLLKPFFVAACLVLYWTMQLDRSQVFCSTSSFDSNAQFYMWKECDWNSINTSMSLIAWWENTTFGERANLGNLIRIWQSKWGIWF